MPQSERESRSRIQKIGPGKGRQVLQRTKRAPDKLVRHIELANLIPPVSELPDYNQLNEEIFDSLPSQEAPVDSFSRDALLTGFLRATVGFLHQHLPPDKYPQLYEYLGPIRSSRVLTEIPDLFRDVYGTRALLDAIAGAQANKAVAPSKEIEIPREATPMSVALGVDGEGKLQVKRWPLLDALVGVEADRIRRCSECPRIFWAGRIDKYACSDKCVNRRNVRLWRERYAAQYTQYKLQRVRKAEAAESTRGKSDHTTRRKSQ